MGGPRARIRGRIALVLTGRKVLLVWRQGRLARASIAGTSHHEMPCGKRRQQAIFAGTALRAGNGWPTGRSTVIRARRKFAASASTATRAGRWATRRSSNVWSGWSGACCGRRRQAGRRRFPVCQNEYCAPGIRSLPKWVLCLEFSLGILRMRRRIAIAVATGLWCTSAMRPPRWRRIGSSSPRRWPA